MDNLVSINHTKENTLSFNLTVEGINADAVKAKFYIVVEGMEIALSCKRQKGDEWEVQVPVMPFLERTAYPFHIDVVADGYHFEPMKGNVNVVGTNEVFVSTPKTVKSPIKTEPAPVVEAPKIEPPKPTKGREKPIQQIAEELQAQVKKEAAKPAEVLNETKTMLPKVEIKAPDPKKGEKDEAVLAILKEAGHKVKEPGKKYKRGFKD